MAEEGARSLTIGGARVAMVRLGAMFGELEAAGRTPSAKELEGMLLKGESDVR